VIQILKKVRSLFVQASSSTAGNIVTSQSSVAEQNVSSQVPLICPVIQIFDEMKVTKDKTPLHIVPSAHVRRGRMPNEDRLTFAKARSITRSCKISTTSEYERLSKAGLLPKGLPSSPYQFYQKQWKGWPDFLGNGGKRRIRWAGTAVLTYSEAREVARALKLSSMHGWLKLHQEGKLPKELPATPGAVYKSEWTGWVDFLGTGNRTRKARKASYVTYEEAQEAAALAKIFTEMEWRVWATTPGRPPSVPGNPDKVYEEWTGWKLFLSVSRKKNHHVPKHQKIWLSYADAKELLKGYSLRSSGQFRLAVSNLPELDQIPLHACAYYKEWISWNDFLGPQCANSTRQSQKSRPAYVTIGEASAFAKLLSLRSGAEWALWVLENELPPGIPVDPYVAYRHEWVSWPDFLGYTGKYVHPSKLKAG
jgi:hypothetical protein